MITISEPPKAIEATLADRRSSLGILNRLPVELLHGTISELDFLTLTRFSRVSVQARNLLRSLPAYQDLMNHAPDALGALSQTKLLHLHSASKLHAALRTECCTTCREYGAYLFLPTCERCCWQCLRSNLTRRVISPAAAGRIFALSPKMVQQLPIMFSIPGTYGVGRKPAQTSHKLVSVGAAKELAVSKYESLVNLKEVIARRKSRGQNANTVKYLEAVFLDYADSDPLMIPDHGGIGDDPYFGMASIPFASLPTRDGVDNGLWCKGCQWTYERQKSQRLPAHLIANMVPVGCDPDRVLLGLARRGHSRIGLLEHIRRCYGVQKLLGDK
ncbi:f-box domain-containing protein [Fusarium circinatum]|uniref:F-box domain-containing protein n=1 Tax=Fusarium circinatum TaxID=48490 RepID=A0A8H5UAE6_FUSCI|nr:f-box domain-containing protein [Fusarium circinatum]